MRHALAIMFIAVVAPACNSDECDSGISTGGTCLDTNAARVESLEFTAPSGMGFMIDWPETGVQADSEQVLVVAAYETDNDDLRLFGGLGNYVQGRTSVLDLDRSFDVGAVRSENGIHTEPFLLEIPMAGSSPLPLEEATLFDLELDNTSGVPVPVSGKLLGIITAERAETTIVERLGVSVLTYFTDSGAEPDFDFDSDGTDDSWVTGAHFIATPSVVF